MDTLPWIALIKYHHQAHQDTAEVTPLRGMIGNPLGIIVTPDAFAMIIKIGPGLVIPNPTHITMDIGVTAIMTPIEAAPGHPTNLHNVVSHATEAQAHSITAMTCHTADLHPVEIFPKMTANLDTFPKKQHYKLAQGSSSSSQTTPWKHKDRRHKQVTIDNPPSEYYSSDDQDSDSEDNLN